MQQRLAVQALPSDTQFVVEQAFGTDQYETMKPKEKLRGVYSTRNWLCRPY